MSIIRTYFISILSVFVISCKGVSQEEKLFRLDDLSSSTVLENSNCAEIIVKEESENIETLLKKLKNNFNHRLKRTILMFYIEGGEVIHFYSIGVLVSENGTTDRVLYDDDLAQSSTQDRFDSEDFYGFLNTLNDGSMITSNKLTVIDIENGKIKCSNYLNIERTKGDLLKELKW
ncbi:hypothetical protein J4E06_07085 [Muricauda sp. NFXS6]|uniref:hypothetical protein n=1 Tax=Allomuricauda sp. NFXS6 TaxID=2819094 RepID=UPI0032DFC13B